MASKVWTAMGLKLGTLKIASRPGGALHIEQRYSFLDDNDEILTQIAGGRVVVDVEWDSIPPLIQVGLQSIDAWLKNLALEQEEMN